MVINPAPSIFKRAYDGLALFCVLNMLAVGGLIAFLAGNGAIDLEKFRRVVAVMRGEDPVTADDEAATSADAASEGAADSVFVDPIAESQTDVELMRLESDRISAELAQRLALNNSILLRITAERERFAEDRERAEAAEQAAMLARQDEGFQKQLAIYESLAPKVAVEHLLSLSEADEAARVLLELSTRKAKKIVEAAKRPDQNQKMKAILRRVRDVAPQRSTELEQGNS